MNKLFKTFIITNCLLLILSWSGISSAAIIQIDSSTSVIHTSGGLAGGGYGDLFISGSFNLDQVPFSLEGWDELLFQDIDVVVDGLGFQSPSITSALPDSAAYNGSIFSNSVACIALVGVICPTDNVNGSYDGTNFSMTRYYFSGNPDDYSYEIVITGTVVPVPAAAWLFCSGLIGLFGFSRKKKK